MKKPPNRVAFSICLRPNHPLSKIPLGRSERPAPTDSSQKNDALNNSCYFALSVTAIAVPPLPKGEARQAHRRLRGAISSAYGYFAVFAKIAPSILHFSPFILRRKCRTLFLQSYRSPVVPMCLDISTGLSYTVDRP